MRWFVAAGMLGCFAEAVFIVRSWGFI